VVRCTGLRQRHHRSESGDFLTQTVGLPIVFAEQAAAPGSHRPYPGPIENLSATSSAVSLKSQANGRLTIRIRSPS
jgi:hypothetical protein